MPVFCFSQGTVRGKITDKNGETIIGASIVLKSNPGYGVSADFDGNFSIKINESTPQVLLISFISYKTIEVTVNPLNNEVIVKNFVMESSAQNLNEVQITAKAVKAKEYYLESMKKKSATTIDFVSSETMKKTGDANVTSAVARVAGVSTNGAFITVRGIGDRYVKTAINGSRIPTLDPFTSNIKLDLFPSSLIDNVLITKTASPDLPGDWTGAYLSVETKDYPEQLAVNIETSFGYNSQSTFKDVLTTQHSKTDWLGYDNNFRDVNHDNFLDANPNPSLYQQFVALGLGEYYNSLGVNNDNWYKGADDYFKLGLVELGLLAPALINDAAAVSTAKSQYLTGTYAADAFKKINENVPDASKQFPANWNISSGQGPLNFSQNISIGNQVNMFGKPLGLLAGLRYGSSTQYDPEASLTRARAISVGGYESNQKLGSAIETNGWNALLNAAYKLNSNNSVSLLFMPNFIGTNKIRKGYDVQDNTTVVTLNQFYEQRRQLVYQLKTEHYLPASKIKVDLNASYTNGQSSNPDFKNLQYWKNFDNTYQIGGAIGDGIHRYYRYLSEKVFDSRLSVEFPLNQKPELVRKIKAGGAFQSNSRKYDEYEYIVLTGSQIGSLINEDIDSYLSQNQFEISSGTGSNGIPYSTLNAYYTKDDLPVYHNFGNSYVSAGFVMTDYAITQRLRFAGGLRYEYADYYTDVDKYDSLNLAKDDPRRFFSDSYPLANAGKLKQTSFLPSANIIYKLRNDDDAPVNVRLNYSQSVARPSLRELSETPSFDYDLRSNVYGNSDLKPVSISNYDFRIESYFKNNDNVSVSLFYKQFKNHIELSYATFYTWENVDESNIRGIEIEGRKKIIKGLDFSANVTLVKSSTTFIRKSYELSGGIEKYTPIDTVKRSMFGQAPYAVNAILTYKADSLGLTLTASYNIQGPRLVITNVNSDTPDIYEMPRNLLDFKVSKTIGKHFGLSVTVKDILNTSVIRAYKFPEPDGFKLYDYDNYTYGTSYIISLSYKI